MGYLDYLVFTFFVFLTVRSIEAQSLRTTCPYPACPTCGYNYLHSYRTDFRGCQECYCEWISTTSPPSTVVTGVPQGAVQGVGAGYYSTSSWDPHPASYWSMSRSSLMSILLNLKQEAQSLLDNAKNTYDHVLHSVIVNDLKKRREAALDADNTK